MFIPVQSTALHDIGNQDAGVASAMINTSQQVGGSLGTALLNTVAATGTLNYIAANQDMGERLQPFALTHGFSLAFIAGSLFFFIGAIVLYFTINIGKESLVEVEGAITH